MTGSCDAKWRNAECHFSDVCGNVFFNILLVSSCSAKKYPCMACTALLPRSFKDPGVSTLQEHGAVLGRSLRFHWASIAWIQRWRISMVCSATPQELLPARASVAPCRDCPVSGRGSAVCHCRVHCDIHASHTACPAGNLRLGED